MASVLAKRNLEITFSVVFFGWVAVLVMKINLNLISIICVVATTVKLAFCFRFFSFKMDRTISKSKSIEKMFCQVCHEINEDRPTIARSCKEKTAFCKPSQKKRLIFWLKALWFPDKHIFGGFYLFHFSKYALQRCHSRSVPSLLPRKSFGNS